MISEYRIQQNGVTVAQVSGPHFHAVSEIVRYALQYERDGPILIQRRNSKGRWAKGRVRSTRDSA